MEPLLNDEMKTPKTYFISGHLDLSEKDFFRHYREKIIVAVAAGCKFIVGDAKGCDAMAQELLTFWPIVNVTVYHIGDKPRNNVGKYLTKGGFKSDEDRDKAMTRDSHDDIAWVRSEEENKKLYGSKYVENRVSGTMKNLMRREYMKLEQPVILSVGSVLPHTIVKKYGTAYLTRGENGTNIRYEWNPNCSIEQKQKLFNKVKKYLGH